MTLRQLFVRVKALPHGSLLQQAEDEAREKAEAVRKEAELDDVLNRYR